MAHGAWCLVHGAWRMARPIGDLATSRLATSRLATWRPRARRPGDLEPGDLATSSPATWRPGDLEPGARISQNCDAIYTYIHMWPRGPGRRFSQRNQGLRDSGPEVRGPRPRLRWLQPCSLETISCKTVRANGYRKISEKPLETVFHVKQCAKGSPCSAPRHRKFLNVA